MKARMFGAAALSALVVLHGSAAAGTLSPGQVLRVTFNVAPDVGANPPNLLFFHFTGSGQVTGRVGAVALFEDSTQLASYDDHWSSSWAFIATSYPRGLIFSSGVVIDFSRILDGTFNGSVTLTVSTGDLVWDDTITPAVVLTYAYPCYGGATCFTNASLQAANVQFTIEPATFSLTKPVNPVVFVHGLCGSAEETWGGMAAYLRRGGWTEGGPRGNFYRFDLFDPRLELGLESAADALMNYLAFLGAIRELDVSHRFTIVAHSAGGLIARRYLQSSPSQGRRDISHLVTYGTPHNGVSSAELSDLLGYIPGCGIDPTGSRGVQDLESDSDFIQQLNAEVWWPTGVSYTPLIGVGCAWLNSDCVVNANNQNFFMLPTFMRRFPDATSRFGTPIYTDRRHLGERGESKDYLNILWGIRRAERQSTLAVYALSPVDLRLTDPLGRTTSKSSSGIPSSEYTELVDAAGHTSDRIVVLYPEAGEYYVEVIAEPGASPSDTFSLLVERNGVLTELVSNKHVRDIGAPYVVSSPSPLSVRLNLKPGEPLAAINPSSRGVTPIALLSTASFDAVAGVDPSSLLAGRTGTEASLRSCSNVGEDVNGDGLADLVCHFLTDSLGLEVGDVAVKLRGRSRSGQVLEGEDTVRVVP